MGTTRRKGSKSTNPAGESPNERVMSAGAHALAALGPKSEAVVTSAFGAGKDTLSASRYEDASKQLAATLTKGWIDEEAARVIEAYVRQIDEGKATDISSLRRWVLAHPNDSGAVLDCMSVEPPEEISIIRLLSRVGSQKLVFLANWPLIQKEVVLKKLIAPADEAAKILARERQAHPLSMSHPNIVETHTLQNSLGETFLVEEFLADVLDDSWRAQGVEEASNLLFDIADALSYLHERLERLHGDVKPDNIGRRSGRYILLDFGIARPFAQITDATATGSLRTRPPEVFLTDTYQHPEKVDVWALGATVFNSIVGRFPLFDEGQAVPRVSDPAPRSELEDELRRRVETEWDERVNVDSIQEPLRDIVGWALERDPAKRIGATELRKRAHDMLSVYLRNSGESRMSPVQELAQYHQYLLAKPESLRLMPISIREELKGRLLDLRNFRGFSEEQSTQLQELLGALAD